MAITISQLSAKVTPQIVKHLATRERYVSLLEERGETPAGEDANAIHSMMVGSKLERAIALECADKLEPFVGRFGELDVQSLYRDLNPNVFEEGGYTLEFAIIDAIKPDILRSLAQKFVPISEKLLKEQLEDSAL